MSSSLAPHPPAEVDLAPEDAFDRLTRLAVRATGAPISLISFLGEDWHFFKSCVGLAEPWASARQLPPAYSYCMHTLRLGEALVIDDIARHPLREQQPTLLESGVVAYVGVPLCEEGGEIVGTFCIADTAPRVWSDDDVRTVVDLAAVAATELRLRQEADALRRAASALRLRDRAIASANDGILIADALVEDFPVVYTNPAFERITGYTRAEILGRNCRFLQGPETDPEAVARMNAALHAREPCVVEILNYRKDGTPFWVEVSITPVRDERGKVTHFVGVQQDVTERHRAEEALRRREVFFRAIFENSGDVADLIDAEGVVRYVTPSVERFLGYRPDEMVGRNGLEFVHPAQREEVMGLMAEIAHTPGPGPVVDLQMVHRDGSVRIFEAQATNLLHDPAVNGIVVNSRDVTDRRRAAAQVRETEERFRLLVETVEDYAIVLLDPDGRVASWNAGAARIGGYAAEEVLGHPVSLFYPREDQARGIPDGLLREALTTGRARREGWRVRGDGSRFWAETALAVLRDDAGRLRFYAEVTRDLTERRRAEDELREGEALVRSVLEGVPDPIFLKDAEGRYLLINSPGAALVGRHPDEVVGRLDSDLFPPATAAAIRAEDHAVMESRQSRTFENTVELPGGRTTFLTHRAPRFDAHGNVVGMLGISRDITDRRVAEEELRQQKEILQTVLDSIPLMIGFFDAQARFYYVNRYWEDALGWRVDEAGGRDVLADLALDPRDRAAMAEFLLRGPDGWHDATVRVAGGGVAETSWAAVRLADGTHIAIGQDVTDRKRAQAALRDREEQLRQAQKMEAVGRLAGGVAHDFNNLLMVVGGHAQFLLRRAAEDDPGRWSLEEIRKATERAASLTQQLLAFSRRQVLKPHVLDLNSVVQGVGRMLERLVGENVELVTRLGPALDPVLADATQMEQVMMNLALNARDAMPEGGVLVVETANAHLTEEDARLHSYVAPGPYVRLTVTDSGHGMDEDTLRRAFEPFFTTKPSGKGTGLGLATVYGIVKQSGGYVWASSTPGAATTFSVYLPRAVAEAAPPAPAPAPPPERERPHSGTVLLVEDAVPVRTLASRVLSDAGYTVLEAGSGAEALEVAAHAGPIDLLLTDVVMPGMDGTELARRLRAQRPHVPVVFMSGYTGEEVDRRLAIEESAFFLQKPVPPDELLRGVREALEAARGGAA
jgi:PAS domain S-box-containing protein